MASVRGLRQRLRDVLRDPHGGRRVHVFDSLECAVHRLAPICEHCGCKIVGHGVAVDGRFFCCAHCARSGAAEHGKEIRDTVGNVAG